MSKRTKQADIGRELGISGAAVSKLKKQGMPVDSADAARRWRAENLHPSRIRPDPGPTARTLVQRVRELSLLAIEADAIGRFDVAAGELRAAMRAVPTVHRPAVSLPPSLWARLIGQRAMMILNDVPRPSEAPVIEDAEDEEVGAVVYALACGEAIIK